MRLLRRAALLAALLPAALVLAACENVEFKPQYGPGEIDIFDDLFSVSVVDAQTIVAVGYQGAAYYSNDGGETWNKGKTPTIKLLYSVSMADEQVGWAVGQLGTILRTEDGGRTWVEQPNLKKDEGSHLFGVQALDRNRAIAVGTWGSRIYTEDGGKTWNDNSLTVGVEHPQFVWLTLEDQEKVRNGGKVYEDVSLQDVYCLDETHCWLIGEFGYIFFSDDGGRTWERGEILGGVRMDPIVLGYDQISLGEDDKERLTAFAKKIEDETHLNVLIDPYVSDREIETYYSEDDPEPLFELISARLDETKGVLEEAGLMTDRLRMYDKPPWDYADFMQHDDTFLQRYVDGRRADVPMLKISVIQNPFLFTVRFSTAKTGMISGLGGVVLRTEDGGRTWHYEMTNRVQALFAVASTPGRAIAVGEKGLVQYSEDGGDTWHSPTDRQFPPIFTFMRDLNFAADAPKTGFIVGQTGMVLRTTNGGDSWTQVLPPPSRRRTARLEG
jgi:photosystem II stability/assembly factor-like uncharacterized protein